MKSKTLFLGLLILALAGFLRLYRLDSVPPHLSNDEISIAYDAYSVGITARDEHNILFPISFTSHGTFKAPLYAYILSPLTRIFGNTDLIAKLPSFIFGLLTVFIIGLLAYRLTLNKNIGLLASLILAVSPWHIYTSRMVLESNLALALFAVGILLLLSDFYFLASVILALSLFAYHTEWVLVPCLLVLLCFTRLKKYPSKIIIIFLTFFLISSPLLIDFYNNRNTGARGNTEVIWNTAKNPVTIFKTFISNYSGLTNPGYLFFYGLDLFPASAPYPQGLYLWPLIIPFFIGLPRLKLITGRYYWFFIIWLLFSPVTTALTNEGNLIRNLVSVLPLTILIALGLQAVFSYSKKSLSIAFILLLTLSGVYFSALYYFHFPKFRADSYQSYKPIAQFINTYQKPFTHIVMDYRFGRFNQYSGVPHLYFGFYNRWPPQIIQNRINNPSGWYYGNFSVTWIDWNRLVIQPGYLYIVSSANHPTPTALKNLELVRSFVDETGMPSFEIWSARYSLL